MQTVSPEQRWTDVQRVIFPVKSTAQKNELYFENIDFSDDGLARRDAFDEKLTAKDGDYWKKLPRPEPTKRPLEEDSVELIENRTTLKLGEHTFSFATYFNSFPAMYWSQSGEARIVHEQTVSNEEYTFEILLTDFSLGGLIWFDAYGKTPDCVLFDGAWSVDALDNDGSKGRTCLAMTTYNKPNYPVEQIKNLSRDPYVCEHIDSFIIVDQGDEKVADHPDFTQVMENAALEVKVIEQPNLGGSGGFSRGMFESLNCSNSDYVILMDDDIDLETESLFRLASLASACTEPTIVGSNMLILQEPSVVSNRGEFIVRNFWTWKMDCPPERDFDFAKYTLRTERAFHSPARAESNGWWTCLIPKEVIRKQGLSMPFFIKWDDVEYGYRAFLQGTPVIAMQGAGIWHESFEGKNDNYDWQAYYHRRNRLVSSWCYNDTVRMLMLMSFARLDLRCFLKGMTSTLALSTKAMKDALDGPEVMHEQMKMRNSQIRVAIKKIDTYSPLRRFALSVNNMFSLAESYVRVLFGWKKYAQMFKDSQEKLCSVEEWKKSFCDDEQ